MTDHFFRKNNPLKIKLNEKFKVNSLEFLDQIPQLKYY